jgi:hypothetical protein
LIKWDFQKISLRSFWVYGYSNRKIKENIGLFYKKINTVDDLKIKAWN